MARIARWRSRRRSWDICWKASTGGCRSRHGVRKPRADCGIVNHRAIAGSQAQHLVIQSLLMSSDDSLPDDVETLKRLLRARDAELAQVARRGLERRGADRSDEID